MGIIEQATKRLEELRRGGVDVPWTAAGLPEERFNELVREQAPATATPAPAPAAERPSAVTPLPVAAAAVAARQREAAPPVVVPAEAPAPRGRPSARQVDLDLDRLARNGMLVPSMERSALALEFRHIKRPLLAHAEEADPSGRQKLIMMTSALPNEGKTYCSINLAMSIAMEVDTSVLLVDADVVRPSILSRLGLPPEPGFLNVLTDDKLELGDVILRTNVPKLSLLPSGSAGGRTTELLSSAAMDRLLLELATRYPDRIVILDAPPLLATSEARVLASRVGQVVVVVDSSSTTTAKVTEAFEAVADCPLVMSILNKSTESPQDYAYGYGYYR